MLINKHECYLGDNGTLDTVFKVDGKEYIYDSETISPYRKSDGSFSTEGFRQCMMETVLPDIANDIC